MATHEDQPDPLFIVHDGERIVVALDMPGVHGTITESPYGAIELVRLVPYPVTQDESQLKTSTISAEPPGHRAAKVWYTVGAVAGLSGGAAVTGAAGPGLGLPLTLVTLFAFALGYRRRRGAIAEAWRRRHRVLFHAEDIHDFTRARRAAEEVIDVWPRIAAMVAVADPSQALAGSLWTLSEVLVNRSALRDQRDELDQIRADLPADTDEWHEVGDRLTQLDAALPAFDTEVDARLAALTALAKCCQRYAREERAILRARAALLRADETLNDTLAPATDAREPAHELADRTTAVLDAYHELTRRAPKA